MLRAFSTAATGMSAQQMLVDTIANNLANINTSGFKRSQLDFQDLMYQKLQEAGREVADGVKAPNGLEIGSGVRPAATVKVFTQGELENTGNELDLAIQGDGFFKITMPNGESRFTRSGSFTRSSDGIMRTLSGYAVEPQITIPEGARISIGPDGTVTATIGNGTPSNIGQLTLVRFANPSGLSSEGDNLYAETAASGSPVDGSAGQNGFGAIAQRFLERSNVQMVSELVNLIKAQRAYEINSRAIKAGDEMLTTANQLIR